MEPLHVLYISYDGICEPLGQSQVLKYLEELRRTHKVQFSLISFEKPADYDNLQVMSSIFNRMQAAQIDWVPLRYHKSPTLLATLFDILHGLWVALKLHRQRKIQIIHARSYVASMMALLVSKLTSRPWIFDMRGFWADEKIDAMTWRKGWLYNVVKYYERLFLLRSAHVISLTTCGVVEMRTWAYLKNTPAEKFSVIPTCVDLETFQPAQKANSSTLTVGYVGGTGLWYDFPLAVKVFEAINRLRPAKLTILNKGEHDSIRKHLQGKNVNFEILALSHSEVAAKMAAFDLGLFFIRPFYSKKASAPTKLGEFLACGVPIVTGRGVGDMELFLEGTGTAALLNSNSIEDIQNAAAEILALAEDTASSSRCRKIAEQHFSLKKGAQDIFAIYRRLSNQV